MKAFISSFFSNSALITSQYNLMPKAFISSHVRQGPCSSPRASSYLCSTQQEALAEEETPDNLRPHTRPVAAAFNVTLAGLPLQTIQKSHLLQQANHSWKGGGWRRAVFIFVSALFLTSARQQFPGVIIVLVSPDNTFLDLTHKSTYPVVSIDSL